MAVLEVSGDLSGTVLRDHNDPTNYYLDPASTSVLSQLGGHTVTGTLSMGNQSITNAYKIEGYSNQDFGINSVGSGGILFNSNNSATGPLKWRGGGATDLVTFTNNGNVGIGTSSQFGSGVGVIGIANAGTAPSGTPTGGGVLFVENGELKYEASSGRVTTIGPA